jgi:hypothetical protein
MSVVEGKFIVVIKRITNIILALLILSTFTAGYWMVEQTMNSVVHFNRDYVDLPNYSGSVNVWLYHDVAYTLLWIAYVLLVVKEVKSDGMPLTKNLIIITILGFALLTAGLWLTQDAMIAVLSYDRTYVDLPFFALKPDLYSLRDAARLLIILGFLSFYTLGRK